jgi:hypothetical protein
VGVVFFCALNCTVFGAVFADTTFFGAVFFDDTTFFGAVFFDDTTFFGAVFADTTFFFLDAILSLFLVLLEYPGANNIASTILLSFTSRKMI